MQLSVRLKTMVGTAAIELVLLSALIWVALDFMLASANEAINKRANTTSQLFASATKDAVLSYDLASLDSFANELLANPDIRYVKIEDADGNNLSYAGDPQFLNRAFSPDQDVSLVTDEVFDVSADITENQTKFGVIYLGIDIGTINMSLAKIRQSIVSIALFEMLLVAVFSYVLGIYLTKNLYKLRDSANSVTDDIKRDNYDFQFDTIASNDELQQVSQAFNNLTDTLVSEHQKKQQAQQELIEFNNALEQTVATRTEELRQQNQQLEDINQQLSVTQEKLIQSEKMASVGQLAAGVAHELNNPIGFISSNLQSLEDLVNDYVQACDLVCDFVSQPDKTKRQELGRAMLAHFKQQDFSYLSQDIHDILTESNTGVKRMADIVANLKQFSRVDSVELQDCHINDCVKTAITMLSKDLNQDCQIETKLSEVPVIQANVGKMIQMISHLLKNSIEATESCVQGQITVSTFASEQGLEIQVTDNGIGIDPAHLDRIFDPFFTTKPIGQGTGLGLSVCYDITEEHGGSIEIGNVSSGGVNCIVHLPSN